MQHFRKIRIGHPDSTKIIDKWFYQFCDCNKLWLIFLFKWQKALARVLDVRVVLKDGIIFPMLLSTLSTLHGPRLFFYLFDDRIVAISPPFKRNLLVKLFNKAYEVEVNVQDRTSRLLT